MVLNGNGVYIPRTGTKAAPNTTIRSVPYDAQVDHLTADENVAQPITAGGTRTQVYLISFRPTMTSSTLQCLSSVLRTSIVYTA